MMDCTSLNKLQKSEKQAKSLRRKKVVSNRMKFLLIIKTTKKLTTRRTTRSIMSSMVANTFRNQGRSMMTMRGVNVHMKDNLSNIMSHMSINRVTLRKRHNYLSKQVRKRPSKLSHPKIIRQVHLSPLY